MVPLGGAWRVLTPRRKDISSCVRVNNGNCYMKNDTYKPYMVEDNNMAIVAAVLQAP